MSYIKVKDIKICYDDSTKQTVDYIKTIIINNYDLFLILLGESKTISLVPTEEVGAVYFANFDDAFYEGVDKFFNNESNKFLFEDPKSLAALYIETLIRKNDNSEMPLVQPNANFSDEMLYSFVAYVYFMKTSKFDDFVNYLKDRKDIDKILEWLKTETRFDAYNLLLEITINYFKQYDFDFLDSVSEMVDIIASQLVSSFSQHQEKDVELPLLTVLELDNLFNEFLKFINAPKSWRDVYVELKSSGKISFEKQIDDIDKSKCYTDDNGVLRILISTDGTITAFCSFVHEFIHYISMKELAPIHFSIEEFPSIFFEWLSAQFLKSRGYKDVIDKVVINRNKNNFGIYMSISPLFNDISAYIKGGPITKSRKIELLEKNLKAFQETKEKIVRLLEASGEHVDENIFELPVFDIPKKVDEECDFLIDGFIQNGLLVINGYQYLLDTYLAEAVLKKSKSDSTIIPRMINVTDNLSNMSLKNIAMEFDMEELIRSSRPLC